MIGEMVEVMILVIVLLPRLAWLKPLRVISEWAAFALRILDIRC